MTLKEHATYGAIVSAGLYPVLGSDVIYFYIPSVLIDTDHYIDYLYFAKFRDWSVKRMFKFHNHMLQWKHRKDLMALEAFHTAEFLLAILAVGLYFKSNAVLLAFSGLTFHMILDLIRMNQWKRIDLRALSFVEYIIRKKKMLKAGIHPEAPYFEAYRLVKEASEEQSSTTPPIAASSAASILS